VNEALDQLKREVDGAPITLLCHSAGGWLGRVFMREFGVTGIDRWEAERAQRVVGVGVGNCGYTRSTIQQVGTPRGSQHYVCLV